MRKYRELILNNISYQLELSDENDLEQFTLTLLQDGQVCDVIVDEVTLFDLKKHKFYVYVIESDEIVLCKYNEWISILKNNGILGKCVWIDDEYNYICYKIKFNQFK